MSQATAVSRGRLTSGQRREEILAAAKKVFGQAGYHQATTREIAATAAISEALLYQHFAGKRQLFEELISTAATDLERRLQEAGCGADRHQARIAAFFDFVEAESALFRVFFRQALQADLDFRELYLATALRLVRIPPGEAPLSEATALALAGMLTELALWWLDGAAVAKAQIIERASRMASAVCNAEVQDATPESN